MQTRNIKLTPHLDQIIEAGIASGRYNNANEVVCEALRLLEQRELGEQAKLELLRETVQEGLDDLENGKCTTLHSAEELRQFLREVGNEASAEYAAERSRA